MAEPEYVARNRELWTQTNAEYTDGAAERAWSDRPFTWGVFGVPEAELNALGDVAGLDVVVADVALLLEELGDLALQLGDRHLGRRVLRLGGVAQTRQHVGHRVSHHLALSFSVRSGASGPAYQLLLVMPGSWPISASSRKQIRHSANLRM